MNYEVKEQLYEGKAKQVFATNDPEIVMVHYKDDATAGDGEKKGTIRDKGIVNNKLSNALMQKLEKEGIPTHYVKEVNDRDTFVKKVDIVPLEVIIRNVAAGHGDVVSNDFKEADAEHNGNGKEEREFRCDRSGAA